MPASDGAEVPGEFGWVSRVSLTEDRLPPSPVRGTQFAHRAGLEWVRSRLKTIIDYEPRSCQVFKSVIPYASTDPRPGSRFLGLRRIGRLAA